MKVVRILCAGLLFAGSAFCTFAQEKEGSPADDVDPEQFLKEIEKAEEEFLGETSLWDFSMNLRLGGGYKDNVTLGAFEEEASAFFASGIDLMAFRLPLDNSIAEVTLFAAFDDRRYTDSETVDHEQMGMARALVEKPLGEHWTGAMEFRFIHIDQMYDASLTEDDIGTIQVVGRQVAFEPSLRLSLPWNLWMELKPEISRQYLAEPLDDYLDGGGEVSFGIDYGYESELYAYGRHVHRKYDSRGQRDEIGFSMPNTGLRYNRPEHGLRWTHYWDQEKKWRMRTHVSRRDNRDNGSGYFDYRRLRASHGWRYRGNRWSLSATGRWARYEYDLKRSSNIMDLRAREDLSWDAQLEITLTESLTLYAEVEQERITSSVMQDEYDYTTTILGLDWEF